MSDSGVETGEVPETIVIPAARLEAPNDYSIRSETVNLPNGSRSIEFIKQEFPGNCAEYTTLNTAILIRAAGLRINPSIARKLDENPQRDMDTVEDDIVIPFLLEAHKHYKGVRATETDVDNLVTKSTYPYEPLSNRNTVLLFRATIQPVKRDFELGDVQGQLTQKVKERIVNNEACAVLIGSMHHATSMVKVESRYYYIDPYYGSRIVTEMNETEAMRKLQKDLEQPEAFITLNDLMKG